MKMAVFWEVARRTFWWNLTDVSNVFTASIIRAISQHP
jgi:hypothetical protein